MKITQTAKKAISAFLIMLLMVALYGAIIALCNRYLREHEMPTKSTKYLLAAIGFVGYYYIYKWFSKRIDTIAKQ